MNSDKVHQIALTLVPKVGPITARKLIAHCGSAEAVFQESRKGLLSIPGIGRTMTDSILAGNLLSKAEQEIRFMEKNKIKALYFMDPSYPFRLRECADAPLILYLKGKANLNARFVLSVVGTRNASDYGREMTESLLRDLSSLDDLLVISGLAYGIDIEAHKACLKYKIPTIGVLAHGLDRIYPSMHQKVAEQMMENGAMVSDFISGTKPERENFPKRNRIIAGFSDASVVVEAFKRGGALITASIANSYSRDVFAIPGRTYDKSSAGCNRLIRNNQAALIQNAEDLCYLMDWKVDSINKAHKQRNIDMNLTKQEKMLLEIIPERDTCSMDRILIKSGCEPSLVMEILLSLELKGLVKSLAGNQYAKS